MQGHGLKRLYALLRAALQREKRKGRIFSFLFIAGNGCGDYYGYRIEDRTVLPSPIYIWEHETFKAKVVANNLIEMIELYYRDKIK